MADSIKAEEEDPYDYQPPPGPSPRQVRRQWAVDGNVEALWKLLVQSRWCDIDREDIFKLLIQAMEVQSRADPARFAADTMGRMTVLVTSLLMRSHLHLAVCVEQDGRAVRRRAQPPGDLPRLAVEVLIPRTLNLQEHLASLLVAQSSIARQWSLVRKNEAKGDREGVAKPRRKADGKKQAEEGREGVAKPRGKAGKEKMRTAPDRPSVPPTNGHALNRVADLLNGNGRGTNGDHRGE